MASRADSSRTTGRHRTRDVVATMTTLAMTGPAVNEVNEVGARTAAADVPAFCSLPWREILLDELLGERPLDEQAAVFRLYFVAWGAAGRLPDDPLRAALRAGIGLAPLSTLDVARFTALLDVIAPLTDTGRAVAGPFQVWVHRAVTGWAGKKLQTEKARDAKARKASAATQRTEPVIEAVTEPVTAPTPSPSPSPSTTKLQSSRARNGAERLPNIWREPLKITHEAIHGVGSFTPALVRQFSQLWPALFRAHGPAACVAAWDNSQRSPDARFHSVANVAQRFAQFAGPPDGRSARERKNNGVLEAFAVAGVSNGL